MFEWTVPLLLVAALLVGVGLVTALSVVGALNRIAERLAEGVASTERLRAAILAIQIQVRPSWPTVQRECNVSTSTLVGALTQYDDVKHARELARALAREWNPEDTDAA